VAARDGWRSSNASVPADGVLRFEFKARPTAADLDGLVAVGAENIDDFDKATVAVRFGEDGLVDVRDGAFYASDMAYPYDPGVWYSIGISADIDTQTYDVEIGPCGEPRETLMEGASFRDDTMELSTWAVWSSQTAALEVSTPAWIPSAGGCVPATCESLGQECGQPGDGCGGTLDCEGCEGNELCDSGVCVEELVTTLPSPACVPDTCEGLGIECGVRSDGCGGYVACGGCESGSSCNSGACVQDSSPPPPACEPDTCDSLYRECGVASDGCGGALSCGSCGTGATCAGWGDCVANTSPPPACVPYTCDSLGRECGSVSDGCGGTLSCGGCQSGYSCSSGGCAQDPVTPPRPGDPNGPADSCVIGPALGSPCICGGSVYSSGYCCEEGYSFSACGTKVRYVRPDGGGRQDGSDWANAFNGLPSALERGTVYWLGAGSYGRYTFDDGASGQSGITLRKATGQAHGTDSGWNAAYGGGQAVFGPLRFESSRYAVDGGEPNGLRTVGQMGTEVTVDVVGSHIVLRHVEIDGGLKKSGGKQTAGGCNGSNVSGDYVVIDRCEIHNIADDGLGIYSSSHVKVLRSKIHDLDGCGTDGGCGPCYNGHSDGLELSAVTDIELVGNMVYDVRSNAALFMDNWSGSKVRDFVAYNNVFYIPESGFAIYLHALDGAEIHNNVIWGRTQGSRYGGLAMGQDVTDLNMTNNIILNINYSHMGASYDPSQHRLDYNLFGVIDAGEYPANSHDLVGDPEFAGIPMSGNAGDHKGSDLTLDDFRPSASEAIDTGTTPNGIPAYDILGEARPQGAGMDRGVFEMASR